MTENVTHVTRILLIDVTRARVGGVCQTPVTCVTISATVAQESSEASLLCQIRILRVALSAGRRLRRAATCLRKVGIDIGFERDGRARTRMIRITTTGQTVAPESREARPSASSAPSAEPAKSNVGKGFVSQDLRTIGGQADGLMGETSAIVRANPLKDNFETDADVADAGNDPEQDSRGSRWKAIL